ncbi:MAG: response regulator [Thermodesulfobacteriota bacterium]
MKPGSDRSYSEILVVDDTPVNLKLLMELLTTHGYKVRPATDGKMTIDAVAARKPDLILLDIKMPGMDGYEVCRRLKQDEGTLDIPIIFISALAALEDRIKGFAVGGVDYITKPFQRDEVLARVRTHLQLYRMQKDLETLVDEQTKELRAAYLSLQKSEEEWQKTFSAMSDMVSILDKDLRLVKSNKAMSDILGRPSEELIGETCYKVFQGRTEPCEGCNIVDIFNNPELDLEIVCQELNGRFISVSLSPIINVPGKVENIIYVGRDVTEQKKMEEALFVSEKMMTIAGLAAGVAHEINTPLSAILQSVQIIQMGLDPESEKNQKEAGRHGIDLLHLRDYLKEKDLDFFLKGIVDSADHAAVIIRNLLEFSRPEKGERIAANLDGLIDDAMVLVQADYDLKKKYDIFRVNFVRESDPELPNIVCMSTEIKQVLFNLIKNAVHAMAGHEENGQPCLILRSRQVGDMVRIEVEDNGPGVPEEIRSKIFDPFYTTKEVGQGTGLGLSISHSIICDKHNGRIWLENGSDRGAKFVVELPCDQGGGSI